MSNLSVYREALNNSNVRAFLEVIARGESLPQNPQAYRWLFGSTKSKPKLFDRFDDHPRIYVKEEYDGQFIKNGKIDQTSAAGKYQIVASTWDTTVKNKIGKTDFSPYNQDLAAVALIEYRGALDDVIAGDIERAITKCRMEWASLPSSPYGQPTQSMSDAIKAYVTYGGILASTPAPTSTPTPTPAGEVVDYGSQSETSMSPLLTGLAYNLIEIFAPIARDKIKKELGRHSDNPEVVDQITNNVIEAAKSVTKQDNPVIAVSEVLKEPTLVEPVQEDSINRLNTMMPLLDRMHDIEVSSWRAEEASRDAASKRDGVLKEHDMALILMYGGLGVIGCLIVLVAGIIITQMISKGEADTQSWAALTGLIGWATAKVGSIYDYRFGSSRTSAAKDVIIDKLSEKRVK